ncbi:hypothetical protein [Novosphingobium sp. ES2-1]|uniref:hypothetical protein n=1 Tax=Novosphingobium sp. ES2-1 TaxID=2780074 RepID=UPI00187E0C7F|nr:hypothetical protein [Novosphingobium sp. ES2-1]QOV92950.1 hypothetical protein IM701_09760 [Novosphingobium sp. ES2-1]
MQLQKFTPPVCRHEGVSGPQCDQLVQWTSVDASLRSANAAENANLISGIGAGISFLALAAAAFAFREARRASNAAERQAEEAVKSSAAAIQGVEDARRIAQAQWRAQAASMRPKLSLGRVSLETRPDAIQFLLPFTLEGASDAADIRVGIVSQIYLPDDSVMPEAPREIPLEDGAFSLKPGDGADITRFASIDGEALRAIWTDSWVTVRSYIRVVWRDTLGFTIDEVFTAQARIVESQAGTSTPAVYQSSRVSMAADADFLSRNVT